MQIFQGLLIMLFGLLLLIFRVRIKDFTGDISFAEKYFGIGGTWTFYVLLGFGFFILGLMWASGTFHDFVAQKFGAFY